MTPAVWQRLDQVARNLVPFSLTLLLGFLGTVPIFFPGYKPVAPAMTLIAVYYWSIFRPDLMPPIAVFALGFFHDLLSGTPLGLSAFILLLVRSAVVSQRRFFMGNSFFIMWGGFLLISAGAMALAWEIISWLESSFVHATPAFFQFLITLALFPAFTWFFVRMQQLFLRQE